MCTCMYVYIVRVCLAITLTDSVAVASSIGFVDLDLDVGQLGGPITWTPPDVNATLVTHYAVYPPPLTNVYEGGP